MNNIKEILTNSQMLQIQIAFILLKN